MANAALGALSIGMVLWFDSSAALADAYGIAVAGAMVLARVSGRRHVIEMSRQRRTGGTTGHWPALVSGAPIAAFLVAPEHGRSSALRELNVLCGCRFSRLFIVGVHAGERPFVTEAERVSIEEIAPGVEGGAVTWVVDLHRPAIARSPANRLYSLLARLAMRPVDYYGLPIGRTLEARVPDGSTGPSDRSCNRAVYRRSKRGKVSARW